MIIYNNENERMKDETAEYARIPRDIFDAVVDVVDSNSRDENGSFDLDLSGFVIEDWEVKMRAHKLCYSLHDIRKKHNKFFIGLLNNDLYRT